MQSTGAYALMSGAFGFFHLVVIVVGLVLTRGTARILLGVGLALYVVGWLWSFTSGAIIGGVGRMGLLMYAGVAGVIGLAGTACLVGAAIVAVRTSRPAATQWDPQSAATPGPQYPTGPQHPQS